MDVRDSAELVRDYLLGELGDALLAVGWYDGDCEERVGTVYTSEEFGEHEGTGKGALENALLGSMGGVALEHIHDESPTTTVRFYETVIDVDIHLGEFEGIVFALHMDGDYRLRRVVEAVQAEVPGAVGLSSK